MRKWSRIVAGLAVAAGVSFFSQGWASPPALEKASRKGDLEKVTTLLASGANPNQSSESGRTPLMVAAEQGHVEVVARLVAAGADVDAADSSDVWVYLRWDSTGSHGGNVVGPRNDHGIRPRSVWFRALATTPGDVANSGHAVPTEAGELKIHSPGCTALDLAVEHGQISVVDFLLKSGRSKHPAPAFVSACLAQNLELVRVFVQNGIDPNETCDRVLYNEAGSVSYLRSCTPVSATVSSDNLEILEFLMANGARLDAPYESGLVVFNRPLLDQWTERWRTPPPGEWPHMRSHGLPLYRTIQRPIDGPGGNRTTSKVAPLLK